MQRTLLPVLYILTELLCNSDLLKPPSATVQQDALALALANMIWKAGNGKSATLCLSQSAAVHVKGSAKFNEDGLTEKVRRAYLIY